MNEYTILGNLYNRLNKDCDYLQWSQYLNSLLKANGITNGLGLDLACGSGEITLQMAKLGHNMIGLDVSIEMLNAATSLSRAQNVDIPFILSDMSVFKSNNKADFITVVNDGVNYIKPINLKKTLKNFYNNLKDGGVLLFDISSKYKLEKILANNIFFEDYEDLTYIWQNTLNKNAVVLDLTFFIKQDNLFKRYYEQHTQYVYEANDILENLKHVGFKNYKAVKFLKFCEPKDLDERIQFIAVK